MKKNSNKQTKSNKNSRSIKRSNRSSVRVSKKDTGRGVTTELRGNQRLSVTFRTPTKAEREEYGRVETLHLYDKENDKSFDVKGSDLRDLFRAARKHFDQE